MMTVQIWGLPELPEETLHQAIEKMAETLRPVTTERILILCPSDKLSGRGNKIFVEVRGCPGMPYDGVTPRFGWLEGIFTAFAQQVKDLVPDCQFVQCAIDPPRENRPYELIKVGEDKG